MRRRTYLAAAATLSLGGCSSDTTGEPAASTPTDEPSTPTPTSEPVPPCTVENGTENASAVPVTMESASLAGSRDVLLEITANARVQTSVDEDPEDLISTEPSQDDELFVVVRMEITNTSDRGVALDNDYFELSYETASVTGEATSYVGDGIPDVTLKGGGEASVWDLFGIPSDVTGTTLSVVPEAHDDLTVGITFTCDPDLAIDVAEASEE